MKKQFLLISILSALLALGCSEENKTTHTAASQNTGATQPDTPQGPTAFARQVRPADTSLFRKAF